MTTATVDRNPGHAGIGRRGFSMLWEYFRMHPLVLSIGIMGAAVYAFGTVASAVVLGRITDSGIVPARLDTALRPIGRRNR